MGNNAGYKYLEGELDIPDVKGGALIRWLENQRRIGIEQKAPTGECELLLSVIKKVKEMRDKYYNSIVEC